MMYRPSSPFSVSMRLLVPTYQTVKGVKKKIFPAVSDGVLVNCSFKTYGGTERDVNGIYSVEDTAIVETWFNPLFTSGCRVALADTGAVYEIVGEPENIEMRNQFLKFKVSRVKGGA